MKKFLAVGFLVSGFIFLGAGCQNGEIDSKISPPKLTNNPSRDVVVTNTKPLLSFYNSTGGYGARRYEIEIDKSPNFDSSDKIQYPVVAEETEYVTGKLVEQGLEDKTEYYWRARAIDEAAKVSDWASSRFWVDTESDDHFMGLVRAEIAGVEVSSGDNQKNIIDYDDPGLETYWQSTPPGADTQWVKFDMGRVREVSRIWMLSNPDGPDNWLRDFVWQKSDDGQNWTEVEGTKTAGNDGYRNIIDFEPVSARYFQLEISSWHGYAPQLNEVILYSPGQPVIPGVPDEDYVLVVGNQHNGFTFSELAAYIEDLDLGLKTVTVPYYEVSLEMVSKLSRPPVAIVLSGNNADYPNLPMFEFNGEFELIRQADIPILGICAGHQMTVAAYGYTYIRGMGWSDISALEIEENLPLTEINISQDDPIFAGIQNPYTAPEIHGWVVAQLPDGYEEIASSDYLQALKSNDKMLYGEQFHAEIKAPYNQGSPYLENFLKMALDR